MNKFITAFRLQSLCLNFPKESCVGGVLFESVVVSALKLKSFDNMNKWFPWSLRASETWNVSLPVTLL